jgi:hypothetical protein
LIEKTSAELIVADFAKRGALDLASWTSVGTARVKVTAGRRVYRRWDFALKGRKALTPILDVGEVAQ